MAWYVVRVSRQSLPPCRHPARLASFQLNKLYQKVLKDKAPDGHLRSEVFLELPDRTILPDYYEVIRHPISLEQIKVRSRKLGLSVFGFSNPPTHRFRSASAQNKLDKNEYSSLDAASKDYHLMFTNAKTYNVEGSEIFQDAVALDKLVRETIKKYKGNKRTASEAAAAAGSGSGSGTPLAKHPPALMLDDSFHASETVVTPLGV